LAAGATPVRVTESAWLTEPVDGIARVVGTTVAEQLTVDAVPTTITRYNVNQSRGGLLIQMSWRSVVLRVQSKLGLSAIAAGKCKTRAHTAAEFTNSSVTRVINRL